MDFFRSPESVRAGLTRQGYLATGRVATTLFLAGRLKKPLLVEGPAGVGKTGLAVALAGALGAAFHRLQCYPGLDESRALFEWNYQKQLLFLQACRTGEEGWEEAREELFTPDFLLARPVLKAFLTEQQAVLLIDEVDKSDEEMESFLLEALSEYQITVPELGTVRARHIPLTVLTSNSSRDLSDALKRRCLHLYIPYPNVEQELAILLLNLPGIKKGLARRLAEFVRDVRRLALKKAPSIAETLDWARTVLLLGEGCLDRELAADTLNVLLKYEQDVQKVQEKLNAFLPEERTGGESGEDGGEARAAGFSPEARAVLPPAEPGRSGSVVKQVGGGAPAVPATRTRLDELLERFDF